MCFFCFSFFHPLKPGESVEFGWHFDRRSALSGSLFPPSSSSFFFFVFLFSSIYQYPLLLFFFLFSFFFLFWFISFSVHYIGSSHCLSILFLRFFVFSCSALVCFAICIFCFRFLPFLFFLLRFLFFDGVPVCIPFFWFFLIFIFL